MTSQENKVISSQEFLDCGNEDREALLGAWASATVDLQIHTQRQVKEGVSERREVNFKVLIFSHCLGESSEDCNLLCAGKGDTILA